MEYVGRQEKLTAPQVRKLILDEAEQNHKEWYSNQVPNLNYCHAACRLAYLYIVAAANANTLKWILTKDKGLRDYLLGVAQRKRRLKVCAFGAGPGTELMAFAKFLEEQKIGFPVRVDFHLLDIVQEWQESWYAIRDAIDNHFDHHYGPDTAKWPMIPTGCFTKQDVTDTEGLRNLGDIWTQDLFVVNFLLSEIFAENRGFHAFIAAITQSAPVGSRFVFIERCGSMWADRMKNCTAKTGIRLGEFVASRRGLDEGERPELLGSVYQRLSSVPHKGKCPRQNWNVVYSVGVKEA
jgi:hypothetical protein